jgi:ribosomal protein S8
MSFFVYPDGSVTVATCAMLIKDELRESLEQTGYVKQPGLNKYSIAEGKLPDTVSYGTRIVKCEIDLNSTLSVIQEQREVQEESAKKWKHVTGATWQDLLNVESLQQMVGILTTESASQKNIENMRSAVFLHLHYTYLHYVTLSNRRLRAIIVMTSMGIISLELTTEYNPDGEVVLLLELDKKSSL